MARTRKERTVDVLFVVFVVTFLASLGGLFGSIPWPLIPGVFSPAVVAVASVFGFLILWLVADSTLPWNRNRGS